jgi:transglutaminase-like putative cysteine protease
VNHRLTATAALASAAASTGLFLLIMGGTWFWGGLGAIIVVAVIGTLTRLRVLPPAVCLLAALGGLLLYLNLVYEAKPSFLHLFPTGASLAALWRLGQQGLNDTQQYASPVPPLHGIVLLATAGIGLVAVLTDLTAVRLRRCALAGLPLLVLFIVPVASGAGKNGVGDAIVFCLGMAGYLALLSADGRERLRLWGRLVTPWTPAPDEPAEELGNGPSTRALAASGRRIGLAAVALALFVPVLVPSLQAHKIFPSDHHGPGVGPGTGHGGTTLSPLVQMNHQLNEAKPSVVLTYHTTDQAPQYLQMFVLGTLTDTSWKMSLGRGVRVDGTATLPQVPGRPIGTWPTATTTIQVHGNALAGGDFLPVPYAPRELRAQGSWDADPDTLMLYTPSQSLDGLQYSVTSLDVEPVQLDAGPIPPGSMAQYLSVPKSYRSLRPLAKRIVKGASGPGAEARVLEHYFLAPGRFTYSLAPPPAPGGDNAVKYFLKTSRTGYCQQFAFAMAVLARLLGIPSRVVVGYTAGTRTGPGPAKTGAGNYVVRTSDAHAWPELYFQGLGWLRMEPTPPGTGIGQGTAIPPNYTAAGPGTAGGAAPSFSSPLHGRAQPGPEQRTGLFNLSHKGGLLADGQAGKSARKGHSGPPVLLFALAALLLIGLITPRVTRSLIRRRRWLTARTDAARAHAAWSELLDDLTDYGIRHGPGETPRTVEMRVARRLRLAESDREALLRITQAEERASYARAPGPSGTLAADVAKVRGTISASATRGSRWQARLLPASAVERARQALSHALDLFGWLEVATGRARRRLARARAA